MTYRKRKSETCAFSIVTRSHAQKITFGNDPRRFVKPSSVIVKSRPSRKTSIRQDAQPSKEKTQDSQPDSISSLQPSIHEQTHGPFGERLLILIMEAPSRTPEENLQALHRLENSAMTLLFNGLPPDFHWLPNPSLHLSVVMPILSRQETSPLNLASLCSILGLLSPEDLGGLLKESSSLTHLRRRYGKTASLTARDGWFSRPLACVAQWIEFFHRAQLRIDGQGPWLPPKKSAASRTTCELLKDLGLVIMGHALLAIKLRKPHDPAFPCDPFDLSSAQATVSPSPASAAAKMELDRQPRLFWIFLCAGHFNPTFLSPLLDVLLAEVRSSLEFLVLLLELVSRPSAGAFQFFLSWLVLERRIARYQHFDFFPLYEERSFIPLVLSLNHLHQLLYYGDSSSPGDVENDLERLGLYFVLLKSRQRIPDGAFFVTAQQFRAEIEVYHNRLMYTLPSRRFYPPTDQHVTDLFRCRRYCRFLCDHLIARHRGPLLPFSAAYDPLFSHLPYARVQVYGSFTLFLPFPLIDRPHDRSTLDLLPLLWTDGCFQPPNSREEVERFVSMILIPDRRHEDAFFPSVRVDRMCPRLMVNPQPVSVAQWAAWILGTNCLSNKPLIADPDRWEEGIARYTMHLSGSPEHRILLCD